MSVALLAMHLQGKEIFSAGKPDFGAIWVGIGGLIGEIKMPVKLKIQRRDV